MTIASIAVLAISAIRIYNSRMTADPLGTQQGIYNMRQSSAAVLTLANFVVALLDVLMGIFRSPQQQNGGTIPRFGMRVASDEA